MCAAPPGPMPGGGGCIGQLHLRGWKRGHHKGGSTCKRRLGGPMGSEGKGVEGRHLVGEYGGARTGTWHSLSLEGDALPP